MKKILYICLMLLSLNSLKAQDGSYSLAQKVILDRPYVGGDLLLYPVYDPGNPDSKEFRYVPNQFEFVTNDDGTYQLSYVKYVKQNQDNGSATGTQDGIGGGYAHMVMKMKVPQEVLDEARAELRSQVPGADIVGPVVYESGTFYLINRTQIGPNAGQNNVLGVGNAPTTEGSKIAVAFDMNQENSQIFEAMLNSPKPDLSFNFNMKIAGYYSPRNLEVKFHTEKFKKVKDFEIGARFMLIKADYKKFVSDLINNGAIEIDGSWNQGDEFFDSMVDRIVEMFFKTFTDPITALDGDKFYEAAAEAANKPTIYPGQEEDDKENPFSGTAGKVLGNLEFKLGIINSNVSNQSNLSYSFRSYITGDQSYTFGTGLDNLGEDFGDYIMEVDLTNPNFYTQRDILVSLEGINNIDEFNQTLNSVQVSVKKTHDNGETTDDDVYIGSSQFGNQTDFFKARYSFKEGDVLPNWYNYEYKIKWIYKDGSIIETDWTPSSYEVISAVPPLLFKTVEFIADPATLVTNNIRMSNIKVFYDIGDGDLKSQSKSILTSNAENPHSVKILYPTNESPEYKYEITRFLSGSPQPVNLPEQFIVGDYILYDY